MHINNGGPPRNFVIKFVIGLKTFGHQIISRRYYRLHTNDITVVFVHHDGTNNGTGVGIEVDRVVWPP